MANTPMPWIGDGASRQKQLARTWRRNSAWVLLKGLPKMRAKGLDEADPVRLRRRVNHCIGFDFHSHFRTDEGDHLHHRAGRADVAECLVVCSTHRFSIVDVGDLVISSSESCSTP